MSIDISTKDYFVDINSYEFDLIRDQTKNKPMFNLLWASGRLSSKEAELLIKECIELDHKIITSSGKEFYPELVKLLKKSVETNEDVVLHGVFKEKSSYGIQVQEFWSAPVSGQEIIINAIAPKDFSKTKWEMINFSLTDDCNTYIKYSTIIMLEEITGLRCGIFKKDLGKEKLRKELGILINKLSTYKFNLTLEKTNETINRTNYMDHILR